MVLYKALYSKIINHKVIKTHFALCLENSQKINNLFFIYSYVEQSPGVEDPELQIKHEFIQHQLLLLAVTLDLTEEVGRYWIDLNIFLERLLVYCFCLS